MSMFKWEVVDGGKTPPPEAVAPNQRLGWGRTVGLGAQHVVAMFGATFVFPIVMGLDPNLAIMFSGICTILFLLIVQNKVPSYLGTSASFVGRASRRSGRRAATPPTSPAPSWSPASSWRWSGCSCTSAAAAVIHKVLPPAVTGAVVMLIGFNLAPGGGRHLLAAGPVDRAAHRGVHGLRRRPAARASGRASRSSSR